MKLISSDFENGGEIPVEFTCQGRGISPGLAWSEVSGRAKSLALSLIDPDAPGGNFIHWQIINITVDTTGIGQGETIGQELQNSAGGVGYYPPCPPMPTGGQASGRHRYIFTLYALDSEEIYQPKEVNFASQVNPHIIEKAELLGYYQKSNV